MLKHLFLPTLLIILFSSCDKDPSQIGDNMQPGSDLAEMKDTVINVATYTVSDANIASNQRSLATLGELQDDMFGYTRAMFTSQVLLSSSNVVFSDIVNVANSMKLNLRSVGYYGDTTGNKTIRVYRIKQDIYRDSIYYSNFRIDESKLELLNEKEFHVGPDSIISIEMPQDLIDEFIAEENTPYFSDNETFVEFFKGIYVEVENSLNPGFILNIDLIHSSSNLTLTYNETESYVFDITSSSSMINQFEHDYTNADPLLKNALEDSLSSGDFAFIQSLGGLKSKIKFPKINEFAYENQTIGINKAQLIITVKQNNKSLNMPPPERLNLIAITEGGMSEFLTDYKVNGSNFGGGLNSDTYQYVFNIPLHLQELVNERVDYGLYLQAANNRIYANRAVLYGGSHSEVSMEVEVLYSIYNK